MVHHRKIVILMSYKIVTGFDGMDQGINDFNANDLGYVLGRPNIRTWQ
jgi:hypothetical protein